MRTTDQPEAPQALGKPIRPEPAKPALKPTERPGVLIDSTGKRQTDIPVPPLIF